MKFPKEVGALIIFAILIGLGFIIPVTLTLGNQEISNEEVSFNIFLFSLLLGVGLFGTFAIYFARYWWKKDNKYGDGFGFFNIGEKPSFSFFKRFTPLQLVLLSMIFFGGLFLITNFLQIGGLTGSKVLPQQFSKGESLAFSTLLIPTAEESMNIFVMGILVLILIGIAMKTKMDYNQFRIYYLLLIPLVIGFFAVLWHGSAYPGSDIAKFVVFMFWFFKAFLILAVGFIFIGLMLHYQNNFFLDYSRLYSSDFVLGSVILVLIILTLLYGWIYRGRLFGKNYQS